VIDQLSFAGLGVLCACGCGQPVGKGRHGQVRRYASPTHRARASRTRSEGAQTGNAGARVEPVAVESLEPIEAATPAVEPRSGSSWRSCPVCAGGRHRPCWLGGQPHVYIASSGRGHCGCCGAELGQDES
jgi:hypothetical protein